ncbi:hypothetical protein ACFX16_023438 [Malus domestica]
MSSARIGPRAGLGSKKRGDAPPPIHGISKITLKVVVFQFRREAPTLPTSLAYIVPSTRGCSPWRPDAVMSTTGRERYSVLRIFKGRRGRTGHRATCGALPAAGPYLRLSRFQGGQAVKQKR